MTTKWMSRKFIVTILQVLLMIILPLIYKYSQVGDEVTITVLLAIAGAGSLYTGLNVLQKKYDATQS